MYAKKSHRFIFFYIVHSRIIRKRPPVIRPAGVYTTKNIVFNPCITPHSWRWGLYFSRHCLTNFSLQVLFSVHFLSSGRHSRGSSRCSSLMIISFGSPEIISRPRIDICIFSFKGWALPMAILISSAVFSPTSKLNSSRQ